MRQTKIEDDMGIWRKKLRKERDVVLAPNSSEVLVICTTRAKVDPFIYFRADWG